MAVQHLRTRETFKKQNIVLYQYYIHQLTVMYKKHLGAIQQCILICSEEVGDRFLDSAVGKKG